MEIQLIITSVISVMILLYVGYCWVNQGVHAKGKGWVTREISPKTFWFFIILYFVMAIGIFANTFFMPR
jgi:hypothetical protein